MNTLAIALLVSHALAAEPATVPADDVANRAVAAAEKAALAAEKAADSAAKAAETAAKLAEKAAPAPAAAPAAPAAPAAEVKKDEATWTSVVGLNFISLYGNSRSITMNGTAAIERKSASWILGIKATGAYGQANVSDTDEWQTVALNASLQARGAFRFTPRYSAFLVGGIDTDHVASIESRPYGEAGVGILWLDEKQGDLSKLVLNTDVAFRVGYEFRHQYYPEPLNLEDELFVAPRVGLGFRYALTKDVVFTEDAEAMPTVIGETRVLVNSNTKISARVVAPLAITLGLQVRYDSRPAPGKENTDVALLAGLEATF